MIRRATPILALLSVLLLGCGFLSDGEQSPDSESVVPTVEQSHSLS